MGGNTSNSNQNILREWTQLQNQGVPGSLSNIWARKQNRKIQMQQYSLHVTSQQQVDYEKNIHELRHNHPFIVSSLYFKDQTEKQFCSSDYKGKIYLQRIPLTLQTVTDIPFPDALHVYSQSLQGFHFIASQISKSSFPVSQQFFGINSQGVCKVWMNSKYDRNYPSRNSRITEDVMVKNIFQIIQENVDFENIKNIPTPKNYIYNQSKSPVQVRFNQAINLFRNYVNQYFNGNIPARLECVDKVGGAFNLSKTWKNRYENNEQVQKQFSNNNQYKNNSYKNPNENDSIMIKQQGKINNYSQVSFRNQNSFNNINTTNKLPSKQVLLQNSTNQHIIQTPSFNKIAGPMFSPIQIVNNKIQPLNDPLKSSMIKSVKNSNIHYHKNPFQTLYIASRQQYNFTNSRVAQTINNGGFSNNKLITQTIRPTNINRNQYQLIQAKGLKKSEHLFNDNTTIQQNHNIQPTLFNSRINIVNINVNDNFVPMKQSRIHNKVVNETLLQNNLNNFRQINTSNNINLLQINNSKNIVTPIGISNIARSSQVQVKQHIHLQSTIQSKPIVSINIQPNSKENNMTIIHNEEVKEIAKKDLINQSQKIFAPDIKINEQQKVNSNLVFINHQVPRNQAFQGFKTLTAQNLKNNQVQQLNFKPVPQLVNLLQNIQVSQHLRYNQQSISSITNTQTVQLRSNEQISQKFQQVKQQFIDISTRNFYNNMMDNNNNINVFLNNHENFKVINFKNQAQKDNNQLIKVVDINKFENNKINDQNIQRNFFKKQDNDKKNLYQTNKVNQFLTFSSNNKNYNVNLDDGMSSTAFLNQLKNMKFTQQTSFKKTQNTFNYGSTTTAYQKETNLNSNTKFNNQQQDQLQKSKEYKLGFGSKDNYLNSNNQLSNQYLTQKINDKNLMAMQQNITPQQVRNQLYDADNNDKFIQIKNSYQYQEGECFESKIRYYEKSLNCNNNYKSAFQKYSNYDYSQINKNSQQNNYLIIKESNQINVVNLDENLHDQFSYLKNNKLQQYNVDNKKSNITPLIQQQYKIDFDPQILADLQKLKGVY